MPPSLAPPIGAGMAFSGVFFGAGAAEEAPGVAGAAASEDAVSLAAGVVFSLVALSTSDPPRFSAIAALFSSSSSRFMSA